VAVAEVPRVQFASMTLNDGTALSGSQEFDANPFAAWKKMQDPEPAEKASEVAAGRKLFQDKTCISCHTVRGHEGIGVTGPDLTRVGARSTIAAGVLENTHAHVHQWLKQPNHFKPGNKMWFGGYNTLQGEEWKPNPNLTLNDLEIDSLVAYLHSLK
jgi:cytochrome c oxidase subunit 2